MKMENYPTTDLGLASYLALKKIPIIKTEVKSHNQITFIFQDKEKCSQLFNSYFNSENYELIKQYQKLKSWIHATKEEGKKAKGVQS